MRIAVVTCYDQNDYVRAKTLRAAFAAAPGVQVTVVRNTHTGLLRYLEVPLKLLRLRFGALKTRPDAYVVTFRGYEMLAFLRLTGVRKPIVFDELVNIVEYYREHHVLREGTWPDALARKVYHWLLRGCKLILADTPQHAEYSAKTSNLPPKKFAVLPMAADETLFFPQKTLPARPFTVFYYGNGMVPLHGLQHVLEAAILLKGREDIHFNLVGGKQNAAEACAAAVQKGAHLTYEKWVDFSELPTRARQAGLCLGGPFGNTLQAQFVVTGKTVQFLACAAPVLVGRNQAGTMFTDRQNCLLVEPANPQVIADAITWAAAHPAELRAIAHDGRALYEREFSQAVINKRVARIIQEL
ncbi:MAG TPA: glycosyltransferase [Candidatus Saccharimonadales bacterium]|nr:glycosyltransferase [Candidatus Saccharimonadales bacterium]